MDDQVTLKHLSWKCFWNQFPTKAFVHSHLEHWGADLPASLFFGEGGGQVGRSHVLGQLQRRCRWCEPMGFWTSRRKQPWRHNEVKMVQDPQWFSSQVQHILGWRREVPFFYGEMSDMVRCDLINFSCLGRNLPLSTILCFFGKQKIDRERTGHSSGRWHHVWPDDTSRADETCDFGQGREGEAKESCLSIQPLWVIGNLFADVLLEFEWSFW